MWSVEGKGGDVPSPFRLPPPPIERWLFKKYESVLSSRPEKDCLRSSRARALSGGGDRSRRISTVGRRDEADHRQL